MASEGWGLRTVKLEDKSLVAHTSSGTEQHPVLFCLISNTRLGTTLTAVWSGRAALRLLHAGRSADWSGLLELAAAGKQLH